MDKKFLIIFTVMLKVGVVNGQWICPKGDAWTIYFQGAGESQVEGSGYMKGSHFISPTTGEYIFAQKGINVIKNIWVDPELNEVIPAQREECWLTKTVQPFRTFYQNMIRKSYEAAAITVLETVSSNEKITLQMHSIDWPKVTLGQLPDVEEQHRRVEFFLKTKNKADDQIWKGRSRGAAVTYLAAALANKENPKLLERLKLCVMEGCYGSVDNTLHILTKSQWKICLFDTCFTTFTAYKKDGLCPFKMVNDFPKNITAAFISSKADKQVPLEETQRLVCALVRAGHQDVLLLILDKSPHCQYNTFDKKDAKKYARFLHAVFKKLDLPYIKSYADKGENLVIEAYKNAQSLK